MAALIFSLGYFAFSLGLFWSFLENTKIGKQDAWDWVCLVFVILACALWPAVIGLYVGRKVWKGW